MTDAATCCRVPLALIRSVVSLIITVQLYFHLEMFICVCLTAELHDDNNLLL